MNPSVAPSVRFDERNPLAQTGWETGRGETGRSGARNYQVLSRNQFFPRVSEAL